jgi:hypothetical protein
MEIQRLLIALACALICVQSWDAWAGVPVSASWTGSVGGSEYSGDLYSGTTTVPFTQRCPQGARLSCSVADDDVSASAVAAATPGQLVGFVSTRASGHETPEPDDPGVIFYFGSDVGGELSASFTDLLHIHVTDGDPNHVINFITHLSLISSHASSSKCAGTQNCGKASLELRVTDGPTVVSTMPDDPSRFDPNGATTVDSHGQMVASDLDFFVQISGLLTVQANSCAGWYSTGAKVCVDPPAEGSFVSTIDVGGQLGSRGSLVRGASAPASPLGGLFFVDAGPGVEITSASGHDYASPVPEPAHYALLLCGLLGLALRRFRSRAACAPGALA